MEDDNLQLYGTQYRLEQTMEKFGLMNEDAEDRDRCDQEIHLKLNCISMLKYEVSYFVLVITFGWIKIEDLRIVL